MASSVNCKISISKLTLFAERMLHKIQVFLRLFKILISVKCAQSALLYPQFTVMQLIGSISVPISDLPSHHKVFFDWGLQMNYDMPFNISSFYMAPIWAKNGSRKLLLNSHAVHARDFTAKELYEGLENILERYGYDRSCLKKSICELSQHPFDETYTNAVIDVVNFFLKTSLHQGFTADEKCEETLYRLAEDQGFFGENCKELYPHCIESLLDILTIIFF